MAPAEPSESTNHSCSVWVSPELPPQPMAMEGTPSDIGVFASVDDDENSGVAPALREAVNVNGLLVSGGSHS